MLFVVGSEGGFWIDLFGSDGSDNGNWEAQDEDTMFTYNLL
jgi:hypothetical protein